MPETALAIVAPAVTAEQLDLVRRTVAQGATPDELKLYLYDCARQGVHPLDKLIHYTKRSGKYTPITSIDFMRIRAADTGEYAGSDDATFVGATMGADFAATVCVWRLVGGLRCPFTATARWTEYKPEQNDFMWKRMPHTMLAKCAEALALRKGFPRQLAGLYAKEEMDQAGPAAAVVTPDPPTTVVDVTTGEAVPASERPAAPEGFDYLEHVEQARGWFNVTWRGSVYKTKLPQIGSIAEQAYQQGLPVQCVSRKAPWLDAVHVFKVADNNDLDRELAQTEQVL